LGLFAPPRDSAPEGENVRPQVSDFISHPPYICLSANSVKPSAYVGAAKEHGRNYSHIVLGFKEEKLQLVTGNISEAWYLKVVQFQGNVKQVQK
jgi:hypothetical protein